MDLRWKRIPWSPVTSFVFTHPEKRYFVPGVTTPHAQATSALGLCFPSKVTRSDCFPESFSVVSNAVWTPSSRGRKNHAKARLLMPDSKLGSQRTESRGWNSGGKFMVDVP